MCVRGIGKRRIKGAFRSRNFCVDAFTIAGITKDSTGVALGGCLMDLFNTDTDIKLQSAVSDENGNYSFSVQPGVYYYIVAYKPGTPYVSGVTVDTLVGV